MKAIKFLIFLFVSYVAAAPLTDSISMDISQTEWTSLWTYFFWLFSLWIWGFVFLAIMWICVVAFDR